MGQIASSTSLSETISRLLRTALQTPGPVQVSTSTTTGLRVATLGRPVTITLGALVRHLLREGAAADQAQGVLAGLVGHDRHDFWPDSLGLAEVSLHGVVGNRQVTDAYLAGLARARAGRLVTLDRGIQALHPDVALLLKP